MNWRVPDRRVRPAGRDGTCSDVGIIYLPENAGHVAISVMTKRALGESSDVERVVAEIARYAYDYFLFTAARSVAKPE